jgi:hypothetical protein
MYRPGCPKVFSGNFASTFVATNSTGRKLAVRVFLKPDPLNRDLRYQQISAFLQLKRPAAFADFSHFTDRGAAAMAGATVGAVAAAGCDPGD